MKAKEIALSPETSAALKQFADRLTELDLWGDFQAKMAAVGIREDHVSPLSNQQLYDFLHVDCGLTDEHIGLMIPDDVAAFLDRWIQKYGAIKQSEAARIVWQGTVWEFGEWVNDAFRSERFPEKKSFNAALEQVCRHFVQKNGKDMDPHSVQQSLNQRQESHRPTAKSKQTENFNIESITPT